MSKARKEAKFVDRLKLTKKDKDLPRLFDIIAFVTLFGSLGLLGVGYLFDLNSSRSWLATLMFCLVACGTSYALGRMMRENEFAQVKYFKAWFGSMITVAVLLILNVGFAWW